MKINLLIVVSTLTGGGAELVAYNQCRFIDKSRFNVYICHTKEEGERGAELKRLGYSVIGLNSTRFPKCEHLKFINLIQIVKKYNIQVINSHNTDTLFEAAICKLLRPSLKLIHTFHSGNYPHTSKKYTFYERFLSFFPDVLCAVSYNQALNIEKHLRLKNSIVTIHNGIQTILPAIDNNYLDFKQSGSLIIGTIGYLREPKGIEYLLYAIPKILENNSNIKVLIVGDGPLRKDLQKLCRELNLENNVYFLGEITNAQKKILPIFDIYVQPSLWEAMSMAVLESMQLGIPAVVTRVGENTHIFENNINGVLVKPKDPNELANALIMLVNNPQLRKEVGRRAKDEFFNKYTVEIMVEKYSDIYRKLLLNRK